VDEPVTSQNARLPSGTPSEGRQGAEDEQAGTRQPAEVSQGDGAGAACAQARVAVVATQPKLEGEQQETAEQQHPRKHVRGRPVERRPVQVVDGRGEGRETQQLQRTELGERVQGNEQRPA
jgi:hypothetical protein